MIWRFAKLSILIMGFLVCGVLQLCCDFVYPRQDNHFQNGNLQNSDYSNTNNKVWEVLAHVTHTWDPDGFDTGREGGEVLIGFLGALLPTSHPHTFPHSSSPPSIPLCREAQTAVWWNTFVWLNSCFAIMAKSRRPVSVIWPNSNWVNERIYVQVWDLTGGAVFHLGLVCLCY